MSYHDSEYKRLMKTHFSLKDFFVFKYTSPKYDGIKFGTKFHQKNGSKDLGGDCSFKYANDTLTLSNTLATKGEVKIGLGLSLDKWVKNLESQLVINCNYKKDEFEGKAKFNYKKGNLTFSSVFDAGEHKLLKFKGFGTIFEKEARKAGFFAGIAFDIKNKAFSIYRTDLWYQIKDCIITLKHKTEPNKLELGQAKLSIFNKVDDKIDVGIGYNHNFKDKSDTLVGGVRYKHSDSFTIKGKIDSKMNLNTVFQILINPNLELVVTSKYDNKTPEGAAFPIGLKLHFGDLTETK